MFRTVVAAAALACAIAASPVMANEPMAKIRGRVPYGDLDLSKPHHLAQLHTRLEQKARRLCTQGIDKGWHDHPEVLACQARIVSSAEPKVVELAADAATRSRLASHE